jgi:hypothetical protein
MLKFVQTGLLTMLVTTAALAQTAPVSEPAVAAKADVVASAASAFSSEAMAALNHVKVSVAAKAQAVVKEHEDFFFIDEFTKTIQRAMDESKPGPVGKQVEVLITDMRIKHGATSYWAGPLAGKDKITGIVTVKDAAGNVLSESPVESTFTSMGGIFGTNKTTDRAAALYKEYAGYVVELLKN